MPFSAKRYSPSVSETNRSFYRQRSGDYFTRTVQADTAAILRPAVAQVPPPARVLDLGCGSGRDLAWLRGRGYTAWGIEASPELARLARAHSGCPVIAADFCTYPLEKIAADLIIAVGSLVHLPHDRLPACIGNIAAALGTKRPPACLFLSLKAGEGAFRSDDGRVFYLWREEQLRSVFMRTGLRILSRTIQPSLLAGEAKTSWLGYLLRPVVTDVSVG